VGKGILDASSLKGNPVCRGSLNTKIISRVMPMTIREIE